MSAAIQAPGPDLQTELINWRERLEASAKDPANSFQLNGLLREVKTAIERLAQEGYGVCQVCHDLIGQAAMSLDPLAKTCLSCFTPEQLSELEKDLDRAWLIQGELLPKQNLKFNGWEVSYHYEPAGPVSGDYCDLVSMDNGELYFLIGDVSGKGVAASLLMSRLHAIFRSLIRAGLGLSELVERANQLFAESTMRPYYATLVCGKAAQSGEVEICNAGHVAPLLLQDGKVSPIAATGLPIGMFYHERYSSTQVTLGKGDRLLLYTDGLSEARNHHDREYGSERLPACLGECQHLPAVALVKKLLDDVSEFSSVRPRSDDLTVMAIEMMDISSRRYST
jgi:sigma-B regulation protein RsbU (phosphoserine phosphatase)